MLELNRIATKNGLGRESAFDPVPLSAKKREVLRVLSREKTVPDFSKWKKFIFQERIYNDLVRHLFPESWLAPPKLTQVWEPTSSWNQFRSFANGRVVALKHRR